MRKGSDHDHPRDTSKGDHEASEVVIPPDLWEIWNSFPTVPGDSGRILEEDR